MGQLQYFDRLFKPKSLAKRIKKANPERLKKGVLVGLSRDDAVGDIFRGELDKYLEVGYRHGAIDADLEARLRSPEWEPFIQAINELQAAYFFEKVLGNRISFRPKGAGASILEFNVYGPDDEPVATEVKSPCEELVIPEDEGVVCLDGEDRENADRAKRVLKQAYSQIPDDGTRTLVVIGWEIRGNSDVDVVLNALYGDDYFTVSFDPADPSKKSDAELHRRRNGFWQPEQHRSLCAVAVLDDAVINRYFEHIMATEGKVPFPPDRQKHELEYRLRVYHNPWCTPPRLDQRIFGNWPQFVPEEGTGWMRWTADPED